MPSIDPSTLVVLGESLAAGLVNFSLHADDQRRAFPQLVARQLGVDLPQPLFQAPGLGEAAGFPSLPVLVPHDGQTTILTEMPPKTAFRNIAIPGLTAAEAVARRAAPPLIHKNDARQTSINFVLCASPASQSPAVAMPTALEYALAQRPTLAIVSLGFAEAMEAVAAGRADVLPSDDTFRASYAQIVTAFRGAGAGVIVTTIPDPLDTPSCSSLDSAARVLKTPAGELQREHGLQAGDRLLVEGLTEIGVQIMGKQKAPLPPGSTLGADAAKAISARVQSLNAVIAAVASAHGAIVVDAAAVYRKVRTEGLRAGSKTLTADFLGGFYSLNGHTPGATGQAALANAVVDAINATGSARLTSIDLAAVATTDPVADYRPAEGPAYRTAAGRVAAAGATVRLVMFLAGFVAKLIIGGITRKKPVREAERGNDPSRWRLKLPTSLVQVLPIDSSASYYGDALRPVHTTVPEEQ